MPCHLVKNLKNHLVYDSSQIMLFRQQCKNGNYTNERMFRFQMSLDNECMRCGCVEIYRHLMWDCVESRRVWNCINDYLLLVNYGNEQVNNFEDVLNIYSDRTISICSGKVSRQ